MKGGYRPGAGRKRGFAAKSAEEARRVLAEMVMREIGPIGEALVVRAKEGDISAAKELFDRAFGRSSQSVQLDVNQVRNDELNRQRIAIEEIVELIQSSKYIAVESASV
jgi:hypothetical protein